LPEILESIGIEEVDGILLDLGLSSIQLERGERGFSLRGEGPLDMRMDQRKEISAADLVNRLPVKELKKILWDYGEERWADRIAHAIVEERRRGFILTTQALREIVHRAIPRRFHSRRIDPATKTFQALRIYLNHELENLSKMLELGVKCLKRGGRLCVISFHSLEDRIVKNMFRAMERRRGGETPAGLLRIVTRKPITPSDEERRRNPRCRSAKLRCAERI
jgi:16S rRNA (cytosine1402-N4)-methyltransferase